MYPICIKGMGLQCDERGSNQCCSGGRAVKEGEVASQEWEGCALSLGWTETVGAEVREEARAQALESRVTLYEYGGVLSTVRKELAQR